MKKRIFSLALVLALVLCVVPTVAQAAGNPFTDIKSTDYFYQPVLWAVEKGITTGTSATTFEPEASCTRNQIVTFLWREAGQPAPSTTQNPFTDIKEEDYFYSAVLWAVEEGITNGLTSTTFGPESPCTRAQVVTFLHRAAGTPTPASTYDPFTDVWADYYYDAMLWAVSEGITTGTSATTFEPDSSCTRGQIVTFLYRANGSPLVADGYNIIEYKGSGTQVLTGIDLPAGEYYAEYLYAGERHFSIKFYYGDGEYDYTLVANDSGPCTGQTLLDDTLDTAVSGGMAQISADDGGDWILRFRRITGTTTTNISGTGNIVTGKFTATTARTVFNITHEGDRHFSVWIYESGGDTYDRELLANTSGTVSLQTLETLTPGQQYYFAVRADGNWTIDLAQGDGLTIYSQPVWPESGSNDDSGNGEGEEEADETKWSFEEATELNGYASEAAGATNDALGSINDSYSGMNAMKVLYLKQAASYAETSMNNLADALELMAQNVELDLTNSDYATLTELVQASHDLLAQVEDIEITEDNIGDARDALLDIIMEAGPLNLTFESLTVELLEAFT